MTGFNAYEEEEVEDGESYGNHGFEGFAAESYTEEDDHGDGLCTLGGLRFGPG